MHNRSEAYGWHFQFLYGTPAFQTRDGQDHYWTLSRDDHVRGRVSRGCNLIATCVRGQECAVRCVGTHGGLDKCSVLGTAPSTLNGLSLMRFWGETDVRHKVDPALVKAEFLPTPPIHADVGQHAIPAILLTIDILFFSPPWSISAIPAMVLSCVIAVAYWFWIEHCYTMNDLYVTASSCESA